MFPDILKITLLTTSLALLGGCGPSATDGSSSEAVTAEVEDQQPEPPIPDDSYRLSIGSTSDANNSIEQELLIDVPSSARQLSIWIDDDPDNSATVPVTKLGASESEVRCTLKVTAELLQEDGSDKPTLNVTTKLTAGKSGSASPFEFLLGENMTLDDVIQFDVEPGLYKQDEPLSLGRINGEDPNGPFHKGFSLTLWVGQVYDGANSNAK